MARAQDGDPFTRPSGTAGSVKKVRRLQPASPSESPQPTGDNQRGDVDATDGAVVIQFPSGDRHRGSADVDSMWRYERHVRGGSRRFTGEVTYVGGAEGERLRKELASVIADLLRWADKEQSRSRRTESREDDRAA